MGIFTWLSILVGGVIGTRLGRALAVMAAALVILGGLAEASAAAGGPNLRGRVESVVTASKHDSSRQIDSFTHNKADEGSKRDDKEHDGRGDCDHHDEGAKDDDERDDDGLASECVSVRVLAGGTATTDAEKNGATPGDPVETSVT